jgi:hypothetical protein
MPTRTASVDKMIQTGLVAWLIPGGGHYLLGHRALGGVFFAAITFVFLVGLLLGGVKNLVNPTTNRWLFLAEMGVGGYTITAYAANLSFGDVKPADLASPTFQRDVPYEVYRKYVAPYPASDVALIYLATAGLLNVLAVLDALTRAQTGGLPTYYRELQPGGEQGG